MANEYATLTELKTQLRIADTTDDTELQSKLTAGSRRVDMDTGRRFYVDSVVSARTYKITHATLLLVDDFSTVTGLIVEVGDGNTWTTVASTQYQAGPENALAEGKAAYIIQRVSSSWSGYAYARITAKWGWPAVPDQIKAATLLVAARLFRRKDSPEGAVKGFTDLGLIYVSRYDPDYSWLIAPFVRQVV